MTLILYIIWAILYRNVAAVPARASTHHTIPSDHLPPRLKPSSLTLLQPTHTPSFIPIPHPWVPPPPKDPASVPRPEMPFIFNTWNLNICLQQCDFEAALPDPNDNDINVLPPVEQSYMCTFTRDHYLACHRRCYAKQDIYMQNWIWTVDNVFGWSVSEALPECIKDCDFKAERGWSGRKGFVGPPLPDSDKYSKCEKWLHECSVECQLRFQRDCEQWLWEHDHPEEKDSRVGNVADADLGGKGSVTVDPKLDGSKTIS